MKNVKIGQIKYPIIHVGSMSDVDKENSELIQCAESGKGKIWAHFYWEGREFAAPGASSKEAADLIAAQVSRYIADCKITAVNVGSTEYPVRSRDVLWNSDTKIEEDAPLGVVHWWVKGIEAMEGEHHYKCDIHFPEENEFATYGVGIGPTLQAALEDLAVIYSTLED
jgi:hypothetical protein